LTANETGSVIQNNLDPRGLWRPFTNGAIITTAQPRSPLFTPSGVSQEARATTGADRLDGSADGDVLWSTFAEALAATPRVRHGVRRSHGRIEYPDSHERDLTRVPPSVPAAVRVYGKDGCCVSLVFDLDAKGTYSPAHATADERHLTQLFGMLGLRWVSDISPGGGRHVYLPLDHRMSKHDALEIVMALARRFPTLDVGPHHSAKTGCIRPPGALHASGGHQRLTMPLNVAVGALERRNTRDDINDLRAAIDGDLKATRRARAASDVQQLDIDVELPTSGDLSPISPRLLEIARHGSWDRARYGSDRSAARQAVITACIAAGWNVADIRKRLTDGVWPGLASFYAKYRTPAQRRRAIQADVNSARRHLALHPRTPGLGSKSVHKSNTSALLTRRGVDEHGYIRMWRAALALAESSRLSGRSWYGARFVLRALGEAAHKTESREIAFGCRSLAEASGLDYSTVSVLLKQLVEDGWIVKVSDAWEERADVYELTIPESMNDVANGLRWPKGKIHALRPAFRVLGHVSALVFEAVEREQAHTVTDLSRHLVMSRASVHEAVNMLLSWRLLERDDTRGLRAFPERLSHVAEYLGADEEIYRQMMRHRKQRALWRAWLARFETDEAFEMLMMTEGLGLSPAVAEVEAV
jgi:DNA-binding MarR family transcriptional regulator